MRAATFCRAFRSRAVSEKTRPSSENFPDALLSTASSMVDASRLVQVLPERIGATSSPHFPHNTPHSSDHTWSLERFQSSLQTRITRLSPDRIEFDLVGLDASIANALRRTLMAEVPTVAIESVYVWNNTSIVVDEVLSHRLGLVPLKVDPEKIHMRGGEFVGLWWQHREQGIDA